MLGEIQDKLDVAKTAAYLLSTARMFLIVPHKKLIYAWCTEEELERVKEIFGNELVEVKELRGRMRLVVGTY